MFLNSKGPGPESVMRFGALLPWFLAVPAAAGLYFLCHHFALRPPAEITPGDMKTAGEAAAHALWTTIASVCQYVLPALVLLGAWFLRDDE